MVNGTVRRLPGKATAEWLLVRDGAVQASGEGEPPSADRTIDLEGGTVVPAFRDAHVHLPATGLYAAGLDLRGERTADGILAGLARLARSDEAILFGGNFEDPLDRPLTRHDIDRVVGGRPALLARADMHSCIVSSALIQQLDIGSGEGVDRDPDGPTGYLREQAAAAAWNWFDRSLPPTEQRKAVRAAIDLAYSRGIAEVHEMYVVEWRGWNSLDVFLEAIDDIALQVEVWLGTDDIAAVKERGLPRIGGDLFLDGSFGSHTAWLQEPYASQPPAGTPPRGISYREDEELARFFLEAQREELQTAVHAIGDAAIEQAICAWEKVAAEVGVEHVARRGHRIEHFECASDAHIQRARGLGLHASVQPAFDRFWGGRSGLYSERIGWERAAKMNRFSTMLEAGLVVAAGSDSTVTPLDPFLQMAALREHHLEEERCSALEALRMHTIGPARSLGAHRSRSTLEPGMKADIAWLDRDPLRASTEELLETEVRGTWIGGQRVWPRDEAVTA
jgi:predicted amidohydrolase YtcJ